MTKMTNRLLRCLALAACLLLAAVAQAETVKLPSRPDPPRLVNDLAGVLGDTQALEDTLEAFSNATSNQILVVTVTDLQDLEPWDYAVQLGRAWGVGGKKHNNGVVILIKPKNDTPGRVTIQVGYGLEGALPDAFCSKIIEREMKPRFIAGDYLGGVWNAVRVIMPTAKGEYNEEAYNNDQHGNGGEIAAVVIIAFVIIFVWAMSRTGRGPRPQQRLDRHLGRPHHLRRRRRAASGVAVASVAAGALVVSAAAALAAAEPRAPGSRRPGTPPPLLTHMRAGTGRGGDCSPPPPDACATF
jgi:uncharacterized protein